jgi:ferrous iron transport protein B
LYFPCISTTAVMLKELNRTWAAFSVVWSTGLAYLSSVSFYQLVTIKEHRWSTVMWLILDVLFFVVVILFLRYYRLSIQPSSNRCITAACTQCGTPETG